MNDKQILVVEDNPDHLELTVLTLQKQGVTAEIVVARDGADALDYLWGLGSFAGRNTQKQPNLVMLDLKLPKISGVDVLRRMRDNPLTEFVPVVVMTSSSEHSDMVACYRSGANGFVKKAVDFRAFTDNLGHMKAYWLGVNEAVLSS
ncbi:MAG: response regulator [Polaromonas sp.]|jgi:two-component system response regulator|nr:response regulator [Polaromonas sp.]